MRPIFLIGYMGSGKTTLGAALSAATGLPLIDLDDYIEERAGASIREIFAGRGEEGFRRLEREMLAEVAGRPGTIVACGGGTPCFFDNIDLMNSRGTVVWLDASRGRLLERLKVARTKRPLIASLTDSELDSFIGRSLEQRNPFYSRAAHRFNADRLDTALQIRESVDAFISQFLSTDNNR